MYQMLNVMLSARADRDVRSMIEILPGGFTAGLLHFGMKSDKFCASSYLIYCIR